MMLFGFLKSLCVSILVGYLAFTNSLVHGIERLVRGERPPEMAYTQSVPSDDTSLEGARDIGSHTVTPLSKILREHAEFQRAATIASDRLDEYPAALDVPLPDAVKASLVNVYCQQKTREYIRTTTGSGFFINQKGVILTNAHVAQFLLLEDAEEGVEDVECVIRSGDPATPQYKAELLYISPTWIFENADLITEESPRGTGERDYALLYIAKTMDGSPLPARFPALPFDTALLPRSVAHTSMVTAGYPAQMLLRNGADAELKPVIASTSIGVLYTFGSNYADLFSISESPVGEHGASGGPVARTDSGKAIGLIVTKGDESTEGARSLRALTLSYIDRTITEETGFSLIENMQGDVAYRGAIFKKAMLPFLAGILEEKLHAAGE